MQAGGYIGVISLNENVTIDVRSRVPVGNLSRVLRLSGEVPAALEESLRSYEQEPDLYPSLVDVYAQTLVNHVEGIALRGLLREYVRREEVTSFPRGRILANQTVKSLVPRGITHKLATAWFQRTTDIPANQCLKYAIWLLVHLRSSLVPQKVKGNRGVIYGLNRAFRTFDGVQLDINRRFLEDRIVTGAQALPSLRSYYRAPLEIALAVIHQHAITLDGTKEQITMPSLVLNMGEAFESSET